MYHAPRLRTLTAILVLSAGSLPALPALAQNVATGTGPAPAPSSPALAAPAPTAASPTPPVPAASAAPAAPAAPVPVAASVSAPAGEPTKSESASGPAGLWNGLLGLAGLAQGAASGGGTATAPGVNKVTVDNPYGLEALWQGSDAVTKATLVILLLMSVGSWYVIFSKLFEQFKLGRHARAANKTFWNAGALPQAIETLKKRSAFHFIASSGLDATERHQGLLGHIDLNTWVSMSIQRAIENVQSRLQDGLTLLATVGSTAPFVGLFGTVWGIYHALTAIGIAGQASIDKVAGPVGEALIMTAIGLAVAVPAVLGYNLLVRRNRAALEGLRAFAAELHAVVLGSAAQLGADERGTGTAAHPTHTLRAVAS